MRAPILPRHRVPCRNSNPGRPTRLSKNYGGGDPTVSGTTGRFGFDLSLRFDFDTIGGIRSGFSKFFGLRPGSRYPKLSSYTVDPAAAYENKPNRKSILQASTGHFVDVSKESSDACTPLKSVAGGLRAVLKYYDVWYACSANRLHHSLLNQQTVENREKIESLIPRVEGLAKSLSTPAPRGEAKEIERRQELRG